MLTSPMYLSATPIGNRQSELNGWRGTTPTNREYYDVDFGIKISNYGNCLTMVNSHKQDKEGRTTGRGDQSGCFESFESRSGIADFFQFVLRLTPIRQHLFVQLASFCLVSQVFPCLADIVEIHGIFITGKDILL